MTYTEALNYIHGVSNFFCKPGLERIGELCRRLGNPQSKLKFIHVGGTNGKGSFCSMLSSVLVEAGYKVGLYTSPYVLRFNERIRISGESISDECLADITEKVKLIADGMEDSPTEFELITAIAFEHFKNEGCDVVILEVGMGGRLDATNVIESPMLSVITGIALDHTAFLGDTVEKIAAEKAGIIKPGIPVLYGGEDKNAERVIALRAEEMRSAFYKTNYSRLNIQKMVAEYSEFDYKDNIRLRISLLGQYQPKNAAIVLDAIAILRNLGMKIDEKAMRDGLYKAKWSARFEIIGSDPTVIFDGAHNPQGICAAVDSIRRYFDKKVVVFTGVLKDKDYDSIALSISEIASRAFTITPNNPRALSAEDYARVLNAKGVCAIPCESIDDAVKAGIAAATEDKTALCCLGSLYTYQSVIESINKINS